MINGIGVGIGFPAANDIPTQSETTALMARITSAPTAAQQQAMNRLIYDLKYPYSAIWSEADAIFCALPGNEQGHQRNWVADKYNMTPTSSPTWNSTEGCYSGNGAGYVALTGTSTLNLSTSPGLNASQNDINVSWWPLSGNGNYIGGSGTNLRMAGIIPTSSAGGIFGNMAAIRLNSTATGNISASPMLQPYDLISMNRSASNAMTIMGGGTTVTHDGNANTSTAPDNLTFQLIGVPNLGNVASTGKLAAFYIGGSRTEVEQLHMRYAFRRYLIAVGVISSTSVSLTSGSSYFSHGGATYSSENANQSWSFLKDGNKLRFDLRTGDFYAAETTVQRSELASNKTWSGGTDVWVAYTMILPVGENDIIDTNSIFSVYGQLHAGLTLTNASPPWAVSLNQQAYAPVPGESVNLSILYDTTASNPPVFNRNHIYTGDTPAVRGKIYQFVWRLNMKQDGTGICQGWLNGTQIVNRTDLNFGYAADNTGYFKWGVYRSTYTARSVVEYYNIRTSTSDLSGYITNPLPLYL